MKNVVVLTLLLLVGFRNPGSSLQRACRENTCHGILPGRNPLGRENGFLHGPEYGQGTLPQMHPEQWAERFSLLRIWQGPLELEWGKG